MAHLARGSINEASRIAQKGLTVLRETEFTMWLPKFGALAQGLSAGNDNRRYGPTSKSSL